MFLKLKKASDTRWLSHDQAITAICKSLPSIITSLHKEATERNDAQALGLSKFISTYKFVASLYMMSDVLPILSHLSRAFPKTEFGLFSDPAFGEIYSHTARNFEDCPWGILSASGWCHY